jgi:hypothetical protein
MAMILILFATQNMAACSCNANTLDDDDSGGSINDTPNDDDDDDDDDDTGDISDLPNGTAIAGEVDGDDIEVDEDDVRTYAAFFDFNNSESIDDDDFSFSISVSNDDSDPDTVVEVTLSISKSSVFANFEEDESYELDADDLGLSDLGEIEITQDDESETYEIDSAILYFEKFDEDVGSDISGTMQVFSDDTDTELTVSFDGELSSVTQ